MTTININLTDSANTEGMVDLNWTTEGPEPTPATMLAARILDFVRELSAANTPPAQPDAVVEPGATDVTDVEPKQ
jgi:hypothetical protein